MNSKADRLRQARIDAGFDDIGEAAARLGVPYATYACHENGTRGFRPDTAVLYARTFKVDLEWLLTGRKAPPAANVPQSGGIQPAILRMVIAHLASEYKDMIRASPNQLADVIIDLCNYLQTTKNSGLKKAESDLAMGRMKENAGPG
jgi:hypothetical protein